MSVKGQRGEETLLHYHLERFDTGNGSAELVDKCKMLLCPQVTSLQASKGSERSWGDYEALESAVGNVVETCCGSVLWRWLI